jgi:hypothetical protein
MGRMLYTGIPVVLTQGHDSVDDTKDVMHHRGWMHTGRGINRWMDAAVRRGELQEEMTQGAQQGKRIDTKRQ